MTLLRNIEDWKQFERFCADLLEAEGFCVVSEPSVDRTGIDIKAKEVYRTHDPNRSISISWRIQCKHFAASGKKLGRKEVEECLTSYGATRNHDEGLFIIVSTDYTEAAKDVIDKYLNIHPDSRITIWNVRQIISRLDRHPHLSKRYKIGQDMQNYKSSFTDLGRFAPGNVFFISDQSLMSHNLAAALSNAGLNVIFLPFWNYLDPIKFDILMTSVEPDALCLIVCFLGDSFSLPMPLKLTDFIGSSFKNGTPLLLFPFIAWSIKNGVYNNLDDLCPVNLLDPTDAETAFDEYQIIGEFRKGDFRWMLTFDSFAEDQYVEYDPGSTSHKIAQGIKGKFGISHSFEYLNTKAGAEIVWKDTAGNPFVIIDQHHGGKICYVNSCCHGCLTNIPISSPLEVSDEFGKMLSNALEWLLE